MRAILMGFVLVWTGSIVVIAIGVAAMWLGERREKKPAPTERAADPPTETHRKRDLRPDPGLLVPWSAVRASRRRIGARPSSVASESPSQAPELRRRLS